MQEGFVCVDCGYKWTSRKSIGEPSRCPKCTSQNIEPLSTPFVLSKRAKNQVKGITGL